MAYKLWLIAPTPGLAYYCSSGKRYTADNDKLIQIFDCCISDIHDLLVMGCIKSDGRSVTVDKGDYQCESGDRRIFVNKFVGFPTIITLEKEPSNTTVVTIKDVKLDASTNPITVASSLLIDGKPLFLINTDGQSQDFAYHGTGWSLV